MRSKIDELSIYRLYCYYSRDHLAIWRRQSAFAFEKGRLSGRPSRPREKNVTDGCLLHCLFIACAMPMHCLCNTYASRTYIVSYLTLYILRIYPVILKNATHRAASFFELRKYLSVFLY